MQRTDGLVRLYNHGSDHVPPHQGESAADEDPHYGRFAYSTGTGSTARENVADNHFCVVVRGNRSARRRIHALGAADSDGWGWAASWHRPVFDSSSPTVPGLRVESITVAYGPHELRVHRVVGAPFGARVEQTGWATGAEPSSLVPLHGWTGREEVVAPQGTAFTPWARVPRLTADVRGTAVFASLAAPADTTSADTAEVTATAAGIEVRWRDGGLIRIAFDPLSVTRN